MTAIETTSAPKRFQRTLRLAVLAPLVLAALLIGCLGLAIEQLRTAAQWVTHAAAVKSEANHLQKLIIDLETGLRGYLLYHDRVFLEPYDQGNADIAVSAEKLKGLVADNPIQEQSVKKILVGLQNWKLRAERAIASSQEISSADALARKAEMDTLRNEFEALLEREEFLRTERVRALNELSIITTAFGIGLIGTLLVLLAVAIRVWFTKTVKDYDTREERLQVERQKLETILKSIGDAVLVVNRDRTIEFLNGIAENLTGWKLEDAYGRPMDEVFRIVNEETRAPAANPVAQVLELGIVMGLANHTVLISKDGHQFPIEDSAAPIRLDKNHPIEGVILVFRDVSQKHASKMEIEDKQSRLTASETQLRELVGALKSANDAKSAFLANMSHEIRTPLGAILGFTDFLKNPKLSESERRKYLDIIGRNGQQLHDIINDILDLSKIEAGRLQFEMREADLLILIQDVMALLTMTAKEKGIALVTDLPQSLPHVLTDSTRFKQMLLNIIGNAIKFTDQGEVKIQVRAEDYEGDHLHVEVRVSDTGIGISETQRRHLFKTFSQADISTTRKYGGSGLGLVLAKSFAHGLGGDLTLESSQPGHGSTFLVSLKLALAEGVRKPLAPAPSLSLPADILRGLHILVAEDSPDNQFLIEKILADRGATVDLAVNGAEAIDKALRGDHDLILMDISMPIVDGYTATARLRESGFKRPIVALTAHAMAEVRAKCLNVGCDDHMAKPIDSKKLSIMIAGLTGRSHHVDSNGPA